MPDRRCSRCGGVYDESFFYGRVRSQRNCIGKRELDYVCIGCQQTGRDDKKRTDRAVPKARNALRTHADKYIRQGVVASKDEFAERFDWDIKQMAHDINFEFGNGCRRCRRSYAEMGQGLSVITLDIIDPKKLPYYRTNVRWICRTCNSAKSDIDPDEDGRRLEAWSRWERQQVEKDRRRVDPRTGTFCLFEDGESA